MVSSVSRETELIRAMRQLETEKAAKAAADAERQWLSDNFGVDEKEARSIQSAVNKPAHPSAAQRVKGKSVGKVGRAIEDEAVRSIADLIYIALALGGVTALAFTMFQFIVVGSWIHRAQNSGSIGAHFLGTTLGLNIPFVTGRGKDKDGGAPGSTQGTGQYASPLPTHSMEDLIAYQPSHGQSFGPKTGNMRSYGPHAGVDFDCRVGGCAHADVASPISGTVSRIHQIGTSAAGGSFQLEITGEDWAGKVTHQLVHVYDIAPRLGEYVSAGQVVAKVSPTDTVSTGPHLDWKIQRAGQWEDPQDWLQKAVKERGSGGGSINMDALMEAVKSQESGGDYRAINSRTGAAGAWQIMTHNPPNVTNWSKECLGRQVSVSQFIASSQLQKSIVECKLNQYVSAHQAKSADTDELVRRVAATWYSGNGDLYDNGRRQGPGGTEPSIREYTLSILGKYKANL